MHKHPANLAYWAGHGALVARAFIDRSWVKASATLLVGSLAFVGVWLDYPPARKVAAALGLGIPAATLLLLGVAWLTMWRANRIVDRSR